MEQFTFNKFGVCLNPNVIKREEKRENFEIRTCSVNGLWGFGYSYNGKTFGCSGPASSTHCDCKTEMEAIKKAVSRLDAYMVSNKREATKLYQSLQHILPVYIAA